MFSEIDQSGVTAYKTLDAIRKILPKWVCPKCGENYSDQGLECDICKYKRPDPHQVIAFRMLMDKEEQLSDYLNLGMEPKLFNRVLFSIRRFAREHKLMDSLKESTLKALEGLSEDVTKI